MVCIQTFPQNVLNDNIWTGDTIVGKATNERNFEQTIGRFDSAQVFSRIFTTTVEHLNFTEHSQLFQIFTGLYIEKTLFFIDKAKNNFEIKTIK